MRIVVAHSHLNALGGGERVTLELLRGLSARHEVELWAGGFDPARTFPELRAYPRRDVRPHQWLTLRPDADAVVTNTFGANLLALRHPAAICYIHTLRSFYLERRGMAGMAPGLILRRALDRRALHHAAALATNSAYTATAIHARYGQAAQVVPCGVEPALFALPPEPGRYALYVGRLAPEKGIERLLRWSTDLSIELMIVGSGPPAYESYLRDIAGPRTRWAGPLTGAALLAAYRGSRMLVFLPHAEELGLVVMEAMAAARPVVAAPEGGIPELIRHGENGLLVRTAEEYAAAVTMLTEDSAQCLRMGVAGRALARRFRWEDTVAAIEQVCEASAVLSGRGGKG